MASHKYLILMLILHHIHLYDIPLPLLKIEILQMTVTFVLN